jgi:hypothetical protein
MVPNCIQVCIWSDDFTNRTLPSHIMTLAPPGWLLVALTMFEESVPQPVQPERHEFQGY